MRPSSPAGLRRLAPLALPALACGAALVACTRPVEQPDATLVITNATIVDGHGGEPLAGRTVFVTRDRITAIAPASRAVPPAGAQIVDGTGGHLVPGLWDMHVHAWAPSPFSELLLSHGITAIREMGTGIDPQWGGSAGVWDWRAAVRSGELPGPRIFAAGYILNGGDPEAQGAVFFKGAPDPETGRAWVDTLAERDADFVKIYSALSAETFQAIAERAAEHRLPIAGHVPPRVGTRVAVASGLGSVEHLYDFLVAASSAEDEIRREIEREILDSDVPTAAAQIAERSRIDRLLATYDEDKARELFELLREEGAWVDPTLVVSTDPRCEDSPLPPPLASPAATLPAFLERFVQLRPLESDELEQSCRRAAKLLAVVAELERAGVPLLAGSDGPNPGVAPGVGLHDELWMLVRAGLSPTRVLQIATRDAARFMGVESDLGTVEVGKLADLVLLDADPTADILATRRIRAVIADGTLVDLSDGSPVRP